MREPAIEVTHQHGIEIDPLFDAMSNQNVRDRLGEAMEIWEADADRRVGKALSVKELREIDDIIQAANEEEPAIQIEFCADFPRDPFERMRNVFELVKQGFIEVPHRYGVHDVQIVRECEIVKEITIDVSGPKRPTIIDVEALPPDEPQQGLIVRES